jgi:hypothetical protein
MIGFGDATFCGGLTRGATHFVRAALTYLPAVCIVMNVDDPDVASLYGGATLVHTRRCG